MYKGNISKVLENLIEMKIIKYEYINFYFISLSHEARCSELSELCSPSSASIQI